MNEVTTASRSSASCNISCWCTVAGVTEGLCPHMVFGKVAAFIGIFDIKNIHVIPLHCFLSSKTLNRKMLLTMRDCITASTPHVCRIAILANYMPLSCRFGGQSVPVKAFLAFVGNRFFYTHFPWEPATTFTPKEVNLPS